MKKFICFAIGSILAACSYQHPNAGLSDINSQYCFIEETIVEVNGIVTQKSITKCSDTPKVEHFVKARGMARDCETYNKQYNAPRGSVNVKGFMCKFADGTWQAVDGRYSY